jgi:hypothetical protein
MSRRLSAFVVAALVAAQFGCQSSCQSSCGERRGLFTSHRRSCAPCQTTGRNGGCFDAATGQPCPCPPEGTVLPGGSPYPIPGGSLPGGAFPGGGELHMPAPSDMIRPPAVPVPAPGDASLPYPVYPGIPVRGGPYR